LGQASKTLLAGPSAWGAGVGSGAATARTWLGSDGVESSAVFAENTLPGTASWRITDQGRGRIEGFADKNYAAVGDIVGLHVSTDARSFRVVAYRMGWYAGLGARQIWSSAVLPGHVQPACPVAAATNMVSCAN